MAHGVEVCKLRWEQLGRNQDVLSVHTCLNCADLESKLNETLMKLSSSQLIIKLLYK
jgi:hypothetical protein